MEGCLPRRLGQGTAGAGRPVTHDDALERIAALEAETAELRAYVPMLARMAFYERYTDKSIPHMLNRVEELLALTTSMAYRTVNDALHPGDERVADWLADPPGVVVRPEDEPVPAAATGLGDAEEASWRNRPRS